jgi:GT2 family glycosyltransferase
MSAEPAGTTAPGAAAVDAAATGEQTVGVVVCAYTLNRWPDIVAGITALARGTRSPDEVLLVIDHNPELAERSRTELPRLLPALRVVENAYDRGLSGARNTAIETASTSLLAFLDDDATPAPGWLAELVAPFADPAVLATGGRAEAAWPQRRPSWFPEEFDWVVGSCYLGMPTRAADVRNVIGCSMAFRSEVFKRVGGFTEGIGRVGSVPLGCEETELCIRITQSHQQARIRYVPTSVVAHRVSPDRTRFDYFRRRCLAEGRSKALIGELIGHSDGTSSERSYASKVLPLGVLRALRDTASGDLGAPARGAAIVAGLALTTFGYLQGRLLAMTARRR